MDSGKTISMRAKSFGFAFLAAVVIVLISEAPGLAQSFTRIPSEVMNSFINDTATWWNQLQTLALKIFQLAVGIDIVLFGIRMALQQSRLDEIFGQFVMLLLFACFIFAVIINYEGWSKQVAITGLEKVARDLTPGVHASLDSPVGMVMRIWSSVENIIMTVDSPSQIPRLFIIIIIVLIIILALLYMTALMILVRCEFYILANIGILLIGLGGSKIFKDYAISVMRYILSLGVKIFVIQLLANLGLSTISKSLNAMDMSSSSAAWNSILILLIQVLVLAVLMKNLPESCMALLSGVTTGGGNPLASMGMAVGGMALGAAATGAGKLTQAPGAIVGAVGSAMNAHTIAKNEGASGLGGTLVGMGKAVWNAHKDAKAATSSNPGSIRSQLSSGANAIKAAKAAEKATNP